MKYSTILALMAIFIAGLSFISVGVWFKYAIEGGMVFQPAWHLQLMFLSGAIGYMIRSFREE